MPPGFLYASANNWTLQTCGVCTKWHLPQDMSRQQFRGSADPLCHMAHPNLPTSAASPSAISPLLARDLNDSHAHPTQWPLYTAGQHTWTAQKAWAYHPPHVTADRQMTCLKLVLLILLKSYSVIEAILTNWNAREIRLRIRNHMSNFY